MFQVLRHAKIVWSAVALLGLLAALAWLLSTPPLRAAEPALPVIAQSLPQELVPLDGIIQVAAGSGYTCALTGGGGVKCWGHNWAGQLGDGTTADKPTPVDVAGLNSGVQAIAAGSSHTCALTTGGGVKCWGYNRDGQLGDSTTADKLTPVDVAGLGSGVQAIAASGRHTCALTSGGGVKCWGHNSRGQLGDGTTANKTTPVDVAGLGSGVQAIALGDFHTCALTSGDGVKCWGSNEYGQLGDGTTANKTTPVDVAGRGSGVQAITLGGDHTCALTTGGDVKCWGRNRDGQLGDGTTADKYTPVDVAGLDSGVTAIAAGRWHTCALTNGGGAKCWGNNFYGQLGDGTAWRTTPVDVLVLLLNQPTPTPTPVTTVIAPNQGGSISGQVGDVEITAQFPAGAHTESFTVSLQPVADPPTHGDQRLLGQVFSLTARDGNGQPVTQFDQTFTITINYSGNDWVDQSDLSWSLFYWSDTESRWIEVPTQQISPGIFEATLDHLTNFALLEAPPQKIYLPAIQR